MNVDSLPCETLCDIFHECVRNEHCREENVGIPIRISSVCRRWRNVTLSLDVFWTYLCCYYDGRHGKRVIEIFDTWLRRSNRAPFNFEFKCILEGDASPEQIDAAEYVILALISHQWHWGKVDFFWNFRKSSSFPGIKLNNMPKLTSLRLSSELTNSDGFDEDGSVDLSQSSKLDYLHLDGPFRLKIGENPMHLARSFFLNLYGLFTVRQCVEFLKAAPNLKRFTVAFNDTPEPSFDENRSVILRSLQFLSLQDISSVLVIDKLVLPALEELHYFGDEGGSLLAFVEHSLPPLTRLDISGACAGEGTIVHLLPLLPLLQVLNLAHGTISTRLFETLSAPIGAGTDSRTRDKHDYILCPNLRWFYFCGYSVVGDLRECADALCTMLESRWNVLKIWDELVGCDWLLYPFSTADCERVQHHIQDRHYFLAKCVGDRDQYLFQYRD
ncbi:uncharacterized protein FOMMEDRAFT_153945 [Fomitiporia mediterranea MF3/22]|uniref:uncharacterized protein n=1 Tax=Fomitiporia mediterranea (strain MF3/22) TaxID=694068 RepID=UPI0004407870|nr:uncharacterized protein FOMMEDRAFT_153945 [Fomitiporia mediterranea MF3/22]EJD04819.1 hypothetical protein FOMMEDRAFT_153945 [Fomitiporia mediterranea MF3/22]